MAIHDCIKQVPFDDGEDDDEPIVFRRSAASRQRKMASDIKKSLIQTPDGSPGRPKSDHGTHNSETSSSQNNKVNKVGKSSQNNLIMEDLCSICGHQHKHEDGEQCSVCGHRKPTPSENLEMQNISPWMKLFTALFSCRSPVPQDTTATTTTTTSQIPNNTEDLSMGLYLLQLKKRDEPRN